MELPKPVLDVFFWSFAIYAVYLICVATYNITLHRLAKFPGPKLWAAFHLPHYWEITMGTSSATIKSLHDKYGEVVRVSPKSLSFASGQAWRDIYGRKKGRSELEKDPDTFFILPGSTPDIIVTNNENHMRMRKLLSHAFSDSALREQESLIHSYCNLLITRLYDQVKGPSKGKVDIVSWLNFTTFDIVGDLAFGESFDALKNGEHHYFVSTIFASLKIATILRLLNAYSITYFILHALITWVPAFGKARKDLDGYAKETVTRRLEKQTDRKDFLSYVLRYNDERGMTFEEICSNSAVLIMAGSETTATLMSGLLFRLLKNQLIFENLKQEIRSSFENESEMTFAAEAKLPYLQACIDEALRIYPPLPSSVPRMTQPEGDVISGLAVPGNTSVGVHHLSASRSALNFRDPDQFIPDRWLPNPDARYSNDDRSAAQPFSVGVRGCLGKIIAYAEIRSIIVRILWNFDMELCEESKNWIDQKVFILWDKPPLHIKLSPRKP